MSKCRICDRIEEKEYYVGSNLSEEAKGYKCSKCNAHPKNHFVNNFKPRQECGTCGVNNKNIDDEIPSEKCKKCKRVPRSFQDDYWEPRKEDRNDY